MGFLSSIFGGRGVSTSASIALPVSGGNPFTPQRLYSVLGPPPNANLVGNKILSQIFSPPFSGPGELDTSGGETAEMRWMYDRYYREEPSIRSAVRGKVDAISGKPVSVLPNDKSKPYDVLAADYCKWAVEETAHGFGGLFDIILTPGIVNGWSPSEMSLTVKEWPKQREIGLSSVWGLNQVRSLNPHSIRLQLDVFFNVVAIVNLVPGLEYFSPDNVLLYTHNALYNNPFGQSDLRACYRAAGMIDSAYLAWYTAVKIYGLPYMVGKTASQRIGMMTQAMEALRGGGYAVIDKEDEIDAVNLAASTGTNSFGELIKTLREDCFLAIRGAYTPFLEGQGGANAHNDSQVSEDQAQDGELALIDTLCRVIRRQLFTWLVRPNFPPGTGIPYLKIGGTDWEKTSKLVTIITQAQAAGMKPDSDWAYEATGIVPGDPNNPASILTPPQAPAAPGGPAPGQPGLPGAGPTPEPPAGGSPAALPPKTPQPAPAAPKSFADAGHNPPHPGLTYNPQDHHYHRNGDSGSPHQHDPNTIGHQQQADGHAKRIMRALTWLPVQVVKKARDKVKSTYAKLEGRYGAGYAKAIVAAGLTGLPIPLPGASVMMAAPVLAIAELHRQLRNTFADEELNPEIVQQGAREFLAELGIGAETSETVVDDAPEKFADDDKPLLMSEFVDSFLASMEAEQFSADAAGHEHKGKGEGGGQFVKGGGDKESDKSASTTVDKPTAVGNTTGVGSHGAAPKQPEGGKMDERTTQNAARLKKSHPELTNDEASQLAAQIKSREDDGEILNDGPSYEAAVKQASRIVTDRLYPHPEASPINASSDKQRDFARTVRGRFLSQIQTSLDRAASMAREAAADGRTDRAATAKADADYWQQWRVAISGATDAKKILDAQHLNFGTLSDNTADIYAKKLGIREPKKGGAA